jgi:hypothetical protein
VTILIAMQPVPPRATRTIYELDVSIKNLLDLTDAERLASIGITEEDFESILPQSKAEHQADVALVIGYHKACLAGKRRHNPGL